MDDFDEELESTVDDILAQLKDTNNQIKTVETVYPDLTPENVDQFVLDQLSKVITDAVSVIGRAKDTIASTGDTLALSELVKSTGAVIEILQKKKIADNKNQTAKELTIMNIESRKETEEIDNSTKGITLTREEVFKIISENVKSKVENLPPPPIDV